MMPMSLGSSEKLGFPLRHLNRQMNSPLLAIPFKCMQVPRGLTLTLSHSQQVYAISADQAQTK